MSHYCEKGNSEIETKIFIYQCGCEALLMARVTQKQEYVAERNERSVLGGQRRRRDVEMRL